MFIDNIQSICRCQSSTSRNNLCCKSTSTLTEFCDTIYKWTCSELQSLLTAGSGLNLVKALLSLIKGLTNEDNDHR